MQHPKGEKKTKKKKKQESKREHLWYFSSFLALQPLVDLGLLYDFSPSIIRCCSLPISAPKPSCERL
jgi:hypothetical protein